MSQSVLAKESFRASILTYIGAGIGFLTTFFIVTKFLRPEEIGFIKLLQNLATLLASLAMLGLTTSISRFFPYFRSDKVEGKLVHNGFTYYVLRIALIGLGLTLAIVTPLFFFVKEHIYTLFQGRSTLLADYYYLVIPLAILIVFWTISELYAIQLYKLAVPKGLRELFLRLLLLISYLIFAFTSISYGGLLALILGSFALCMLVSILYLRSLIPLNLEHNPSFITPSLRKDFKHYTLLAVLSTVGTMLAGQMDFLMLSFIHRDGLYETGIFTIAFFMVSVIEIPTRSLISIATPRIAEAMKEENYQTTQSIYQKVSFYQLLSGLILALIIWVNFENILTIMPNGIEVYQHAQDIFIFLVLAKLIELIFTPCHPIINCSKYYRWSLYYTLWLCVIAFFSNLYLIPLWGSMGAGISTFITALIGYGFLQTLLYRKLGIQPISKQLLLLFPLIPLLLLGSKFLPFCFNSFIDIALRTVVLGGLAIAYLYLTGISRELFAFFLSKIKFK